MIMNRITNKNIVDIILGKIHHTEYVIYPQDVIDLLGEPHDFLLSNYDKKYIWRLYFDIGNHFHLGFVHDIFKGGTYITLENVIHELLSDITDDEIILLITDRMTEVEMSKPTNNTPLLSELDYVPDFLHFIDKNKKIYHSHELLNFYSTMDLSYIVQRKMEGYYNKNKELTK